ncbi:hypothetical protein JYU16_00315 [bacterium AH-315-M05]|nr:hypothetical protein [bacterium AH-315-M05]
MNFKEGDKVSFSNQTGEGIITSIVNDELVTVDMGDGFETPVLIKELIKILPENIKSFQGEIGKAAPPRPSPKGRESQRSKNHYCPKRNESKYRKKPGKRSKKKQIIPEEIDLHIEELIDDHTGLTNAEIVTIQLNHFRKCLDEAILNNKRKIIFIHGVGKGTLKSEMDMILKTYENITSYDASYARYGFGATEVIIK